MTQASADKSAFERVLEVGVYAPLGYLLTRRKTRPELIAAGRKQIAFSRSLGRAALKSVARGRGTEPTNPAKAPPEPVQLSRTQVEAPVASQDLASIDGYDDMTAKAVVGLIPSATSEQLAWIVEHESAKKQRVTVLRAAAKRRET